MINISDYMKHLIVGRTDSFCNNKKTSRASKMEHRMSDERHTYYRDHIFLVDVGKRKKVKVAFLVIQQWNSISGSINSFYVPLQRLCDHQNGTKPQTNIVC